MKIGFLSRIANAGHLSNPITNQVEHVNTLSFFRYREMGLKNGQFIMEKFHNIE